VPGGLITAGTWNWTNGVGLVVIWVLAAGSNFQTTAGSWFVGGGRFATANQVNCLDTIGNIFAITGVQLEVGSVATPFEHRPFGTELALCQRYFEIQSAKTYIDYSPGGIDSLLYGSWTVEKRASPTLTVSSATNVNTVVAGAVPTKSWIAGLSSGGAIGYAAATITASIEL